MIIICLIFESMHQSLYRIFLRTCVFSRQ